MEVNKLMENYGTNQKHYDSVSNEWNVCKVAIEDSPLSPPLEGKQFFEWEHPAKLPGRMPKWVVLLFGLRFDNAQLEESCSPLENFATNVLYHAFGGHKQLKMLEDRPINHLLCAVFQQCQHRSKLHWLDELFACNLVLLCPDLQQLISKLVSVVNNMYIILPMTLCNPAPHIVVYTPEAAVFVCWLDNSNYKMIVLAFYRHRIQFNACYKSTEQPSQSTNDHLFSIVSAAYCKGTKSDQCMYQNYMQVCEYILDCGGGHWK
ncbi:hypothetical protein H1R20_g13352, partial [Candolleomyces eurysporus]